MRNRVAPFGRSRKRAAAVVVALALAACGSPASDDEAAQGSSESPAATTNAAGSEVDSGDSVVLGFQEFYSPGQVYGDATAAFGESVTEATDGSVEFEFHWANAVVPYAEVLPALSDGLLDVGRLGAAITPQDIPALAWWIKFSHLTNDAFPAGMLQGIAAQAEMVMTTPVFREELANGGVHLLGVFQLVPAFELFCREPAPSLEDLEGRRIRLTGEPWLSTVEALGAEGVTLSGGELYEAYQRGIVDCEASSPQPWVDLGLADIGGYHVPVRMTGYNDTFGVNLDTWESLSAEQQEAMYGGVRAWLETYIPGAAQVYWDWASDTPDGVELQELDPEMQEAVEAHHEQLRASAAETAPSSVSDPDALISRYEELHDKWGSILEELGYELSQNDEAWYAGVREGADLELDLDPFLDRLMQEAYGLGD